MPILVLTFLVQACFIYHVFKTGRPYWWAYVILGFPVIGCVVYYFVEVFPGSREHRAAGRASRNLSRAFNPDKELKKLVEAVEIAPTVQNRTALAEELLRFGRIDEATDLYVAARTGPHANDADLMYGLARAHIAGQKYADASSIVDEVQQKHPSFRVEQVALLRARVLEGLGEHPAALDQYERVAETFVGLEAKVRYGQLLQKMGHETHACTIFEQVVTHAKRFNIKHEEERGWLEIALKELAKS